MTNPAHIVETALLLLAAYLVGCTLGYGLRRLLHAARGTRNVAPPSVAPADNIVAFRAEPRRAPSPAARLAAAATPDEAAPAVAPRVAGKPKPAPAKPRTKPKPLDPKPLALKAARDGRADNLKQIKGIGPKIEASLNAMGIYHFDQVAAWTKVNVDWVDGQLAFKGRIRRERWVEQAMELSKVQA